MKTALNLNELFDFSNTSGAKARGEKELDSVDALSGAKAEFAAQQTTLKPAKLDRSPGYGEVQTEPKTKPEPEPKSPTAGWRDKPKAKAKPKVEKKPLPTQQSVPYGDDPDLRILAKYFDVDLTSRAAKRLNTIVDYAVKAKGARSQKELLSVVKKMHNDNRSLGGMPEAVVYRVAMLGL